MRPFLAVLFLTAALLPAGEVRILPGEEWKAADLSDLVIREGSALDFSGLVPRAPAGSSGRVIASGLRQASHSSGSRSGTSVS